MFNIKYSNEPNIIKAKFEAGGQNSFKKYFNEENEYYSGYIFYLISGAVNTGGCYHRFANNSISVKFYYNPLKQENQRQGVECNFDLSNVRVIESDNITVDIYKNIILHDKIPESIKKHKIQLIKNTEVKYPPILVGYIQYNSNITKISNIFS